MERKGRRLGRLRRLTAATPCSAKERAPFRRIQQQRRSCRQPPARLPVDSSSHDWLPGTTARGGEDALWGRQDPAFVILPRCEMRCERAIRKQAAASKWLARIACLFTAASSHGSMHSQSSISAHSNGCVAISTHPLVLRKRPMARHSNVAGTSKESPSQ